MIFSSVEKVFEVAPRQMVEVSFPSENDDKGWGLTSNDVVSSQSVCWVGDMKSRNKRAMSADLGSDGP